MIDTLNQARKILDEKKATLVLMKDGIVFVSDKKGITPLIELAEKGTYEGYTASDLIVGKAAALLYTLLKVKAIYAVVITKEAKDILENNNIYVKYDILTDKIINRNKTDICPMEKVVTNVNDAKEAYILIKQKLKSLANNK